MNKMAERIEEAFSDHYLRTEEPDFWDGERAGERAGDPVIWAIAGAAHISEQAAEDVQLILEDKHDDFESAQMGDETEFSRGPTMKRPAQRAEACLD